MYLDFYGLKRMPFETTPDPDFFFPSSKHKEALSMLIYAISSRKGFVVITGEVGSGKTTVCRTLLSKLDPSARIVLIPNPHLNEEEFLYTIFEKFKLQPNGKNKAKLLLKLNECFLKELWLNNKVVLIVDESQNLSLPVLEEIRLVSNLETDREKLIQIILLGQPQLREKLNEPQLKQLKQRINLRYHLNTLDREESEKYIYHRLAVAGPWNCLTFKADALDRIYDYSRGVPRLINIVCDLALLVGYIRETRRINKDIIDSVIEDFE